MNYRYLMDIYRKRHRIYKITTGRIKLKGGNTNRTQRHRHSGWKSHKRRHIWGLPERQKIQLQMAPPLTLEIGCTVQFWKKNSLIMFAYGRPSWSRSSRSSLTLPNLKNVCFNGTPHLIASWILEDGSPSSTGISMIAMADNPIKIMHWKMRK